MSAWERYVVSLSSDALARLGRAFVPDVARVLLAQPDVQGQLKLLGALDGNRVGVFAYCFCEIK